MLEDRDLERLHRTGDETRIIIDAALGKIRAQLLGKTSAVRLTAEDKSEVLLAKRKKISEEVLDEIPKERWAEIGVEEDPELKTRLSDAWRVCLDQVALVKAMFDEKISRIRRGDELPPGVLKMVKVFIAMKRNSPSETRWRAATGTRASSPGFCRKRTCRTRPTARRWTWC